MHNSCVPFQNGSEGQALKLMPYTRDYHYCMWLVLVCMRHVRDIRNAVDIRLPMPIPGKPPMIRVSLSCTACLFRPERKHPHRIQLARQSMLQLRFDNAQPGLLKYAPECFFCPVCAC